MSNNLITLFNLLIKRNETSTLNIIKNKLYFFSIPHIIYVYGTSYNKDIFVIKKYKFYVNGITKFMIIDDENKHYCVNNSLWYWKWNSLEDWHKIQENRRIKIKLYGYRIPMFGMFPNIFYYQ